VTSVLAVDIGNTDVKFGLFVDQLLVQQWRLADWRQIAPQELSESLKQALTVAKEPYEALVFSSVAPEADTALKSAVLDLAILPEGSILDVNPSQWSAYSSFQLPIDFSLYAGGQLGTDRLITTCAAALKYPKQALLVVNFGTATTFDSVDANGLYQGGAIAPGWRIFTQVLSEKTAKLPLLDFSEKAYSTIGIGLNTVACIEAGLGIGYRGLVLSLMDKFKEGREGTAFKVLTTGGLAIEVAQVCGLDTIENNYHSTLLLEGLAGIYKG